MGAGLSAELGLGAGIERRIRRSLDVADHDIVLNIGDHHSVASATVALSIGALTALDGAAQVRTLGAAYESLTPGTRIGIVEMCLRPDVLDDAVADELRRDASEIFERAIRPNTPSHWWALLEQAGFTVVHRLDADLKFPRGRGVRRLVSTRRFELGVVGLAALRDE